MKFAGRPSSARTRETFTGRMPFVSQRVTERVNPVSNTAGYFYNSNRFDRRLSLTSSSSGVAACLGHPDHFGHKIHQHAERKTQIKEPNSHAYVRPTHSRGRTSSSVVVHRPLSASFDKRPFTREQMKQDVCQASANVIHTFDPVRRTIAYPTVRQTPTFSSSVFAHLPEFNQLRNPPRNTELGQDFLRKKQHYEAEHPLSNGNGELVVYSQEQLPPAGSANSAAPQIQIAHAQQPYTETRQETAQTITEMKNGNYVDNTSNKIYGVTHISPTKRRHVEPNNLPSLSDADARKEMYESYKQELVNEIKAKERQAEEYKLSKQRMSQKPRSAFEFECYQQEKNRMREIADVSAAQREQMEIVKERNAIEKDKKYTDLSERDFDYRAWQKNNFICIDGPQVQNNPCIVIMPPPLLNSGYVYQGIKPGVLILEESAQSQVVKDLVKESKQARVREIEKQKLNKKRNDILSDIVDVPKNIESDLQKINEEEENLQDKKQAENESKEKINDSSILPRKIQESVINEKKNESKNQSREEEQQFRFTPSLNTSKAQEEEEPRNQQQSYATAGFKEQQKQQDSQQKRCNLIKTSNKCIPSPYLKSTLEENNQQHKQFNDSLPQTPKQFPNVDEDELLVINPTKSFMLNSYSRMPKRTEVQTSLNIYSAVKTQQSRIQEEQHLSEIPKQLNTPPTISKFQNNTTLNNTNLATTINMYNNEEEYEQAIPNQSQSSLIPKTNHPSTASRKGKIKTITNMNKNTSSSPCLRIASREDSQQEQDGDQQKRQYQQILNSNVIIQNLDLQTRQSCTVEEQNNTNETHLYELRQFQTKQLGGNKTPYPSEQKIRKKKNNESKFHGIISTTPSSSSTPYNTKTINTCTNKTYNNYLLRSVTQEEEDYSSQNFDNYRTTPNSEANRNPISRLYYKGVRDKSIMQRLNYQNYRANKNDDQSTPATMTTIEPYKQKIIHLREKLVQIQQKGRDILPLDTKNRKNQLSKKSKNSSSYKSFQQIMKNTKQRDSSGSINLQPPKPQKDSESSQRKPISSIKIQRNINGTWHVCDQSREQQQQERRESSSSLRHSKLKQQILRKYDQKRQECIRKQKTSYFNDDQDNNINDECQTVLRNYYSKTPSARNKAANTQLSRQKNSFRFINEKGGRQKQSAFNRGGAIQSFIKNSGSSDKKLTKLNRSPSADRIIASNYKNTELYMQNVSKIMSNRTYKNNSKEQKKSLEHLTPPSSAASGNKMSRGKHQIQSKMAHYGRILNRDASSGKLLSTGRKYQDVCKENTNNNIENGKKFISSSFVVPSYSLTSRVSSQWNEDHEHLESQKQKKIQSVKNIQNQMLYKKFGKKNICSPSSSSSSSQQFETETYQNTGYGNNEGERRSSKYEWKAQKAGAAIVLNGRNAVVGLSSDRSARNKRVANNIKSPFGQEQEKGKKKTGLYNSFALKH